MNIFNIMNFVRACDERDPNYKENLFNLTKHELELVNEFNVENTFLLQYDALTDERYVKLFKENITEKTELGIWLEIVEPMTSACSLPYKSQNNWKWDWHIIPGLPMGYTPFERELLVHETMRKFKEVFGFYPKTVGGWLIDTHTMNCLSENYEINAFCICRDQVNTDAYTLVGGYFNGAYYPSKNNIFTPAQTKANQVNSPVFRLLGPCPVVNYDGNKFIPENHPLHGSNVFTLEPAWGMGTDKECVNWMFKNYFENESLGFSALQLGQENSFSDLKIIKHLRMQLEEAEKYVKENKAQFKTYSETGKLFKSLYEQTPATAVSALDNWTDDDLQSVYYDCKNYIANIFRNKNEIFIRAFYLFDENIKDYYIKDKCTRFDAVYENLPVIDTVIWQKGNKENIGLILDKNAANFEVKKSDEKTLTVTWNDKYVTFTENKIIIENCEECTFQKGKCTAEITVFSNEIKYSYNNCNYSLFIEKGKAENTGSGFVLSGNTIILSFGC